MSRSLHSPKWFVKPGESDSGEVDLAKVLKPCLVFIGKSGDSIVQGISSESELLNSYGADKILYKSWREDSVNGKFCKISQEDHGMGLMWRDSYNGGKEVTGKPRFIIPRVKTYSRIEVEGSSSEYEEVYDSPKIDITTGDITVYSVSESPVYLVVIY